MFNLDILKVRKGLEMLAGICHRAAAVWESTENPVALRALKVIVCHGLLQQFNKSSSGSPKTIQLSVLICSSLWWKLPLMLKDTNPSWYGHELTESEANITDMKFSTVLSKRLSTCINLQTWEDTRKLFFIV